MDCGGSSYPLGGKVEAIFVDAAFVFVLLLISTHSFGLSLFFLHCNDGMQIR